MSARASAFWYRTAETFLYLLVFILPVAFYLRTYDSAQVKTTAMQLGTLAVFAAWLLKGLERGRWELASAARPLLLPALALMGWEAVRFAAAPHKWAALDGFLRDMCGLAVYCVVALEFGGQENARRLAGWLLAAGWAAAAYAVLQRLGLDPWIWADAFGEGVAFSTLANPDFLGLFLALCVPLAAAQLLDDELPLWLRAHAVLLLPLLAAAAWFTAHAEAVLSVVTAAAAFAVLFPLFFRSRRSWLPSAAAGLVAVGLAAGWAADGADLDRSLASRAGFKAPTWAAALRLAAEQPLIGKGPGSFAVHYPRFRRPEILRREGKANTETSHPESLGLELLAELGLLGLALSLWGLAAVYSAAWRAARAFERQGADGEGLYLAAFASTAAGFLLAGQFATGIHFSAPGFLLAPVLGMAAGLAWLAFPSREVRVLPVAFGDDAKRFLLVPVTACLLWLASFPVAWFDSDIEHNMAVAYSKRQMWNEALAHYDKVRPGAPAYLMAQYFKGNVLLDSGRPAEALELYAKLQEQAPDYVQVHYQKGAAYLKLGDAQSAVASFRRYVELIPVFPDGFQKLAEASRAAGDLASARRATLGAVALDPKDPKPWRVLAELYVADKRMVAARRMKDQAARTAKAWPGR